MHEKTKEILKCIHEEAQNVKIENCTPLARYINSGQYLERTSRQYLTDGNIVACYFLLNKLLTIFVEKLKSHQDYKNLTANQKILIKKIVEKNIQFMGKVKQKLIEILDHEYEIEEKIDSDLDTINVEKVEEPPNIELKSQKSIDDIFNDTCEFKSIDHDFNKTTIVDKILDEPKSLTQPDAKWNKMLNPIFETPLSHDNVNKIETYDFSLRSKSNVSNLNAIELNQEVYPGVPKNYMEIQNSLIQSREKIVSNEIDRNLKPKNLNSKQNAFDSQSNIFFQNFSNESRADSQISIDQLKFEFNRNLKPQRTSFENLNRQQELLKPPIDRTRKRSIDKVIKNIINNLSHGLKNVKLPNDIHEKFLQISDLNNKFNRETCGILAGVSSGDTCIVTHLIVPKQTGSSDSCECLNEEEILYFQDKNNIVTLGWIHTHPSQSCFLSSVDLHTHYGYQCLLPEAIAIVVSIKHQKMEIYNLTEFGLRSLQTCFKEGFHVHENSNMYFEVAKHVNTTEKSILIEDLRN